LNLRAFISQRLIPTVDGKRCVAVEVLLGTPLVCDMILKGQIHKIKEVMEKSTNIGMQTFDGALFELYKHGKISLEEALRNADSQNNLRLKISLSEGKPGGQDTGSLSLAGEEEPPPSTVAAPGVSAQAPGAKSLSLQPK
jgi:twitching motility protein PilU